MPDFSKLGLYRKREFIENSPDFSSREETEKLFNELLDFPVQSREGVWEFLRFKAELFSAIDQYGSMLNIKLTCDTSDKEVEKLYRHFTTAIRPLVIAFSNQIDKKTSKLLKEYPLDKEKSEVLSRALQTDLEIYTEKNVELFTEESLLVQKYEKLAGSQLVEFEGKKQTFQQMAKYQLRPERNIRESAWRASAGKRFTDRQSFESLFAEMVELRSRIAENAGFENYLEYVFQDKHRFDYTPQNCKEFHEAIEKVVVPALSEIYEDRKLRLGVDTLMPWDLAVDPDGNPPLKPFENTEELLSKASSVFHQLNGRLAGIFDMMRMEGLFDLESRKNKAPGGYQSTLFDAGVPFIFANLVGVNDDLRIIFHESGHAFHTFACRDQQIFEYRHAPMEFCEVASMSMELLVMPYLSLIYQSGQECRRAECIQLEKTLQILASVAMVDAFQHRIYEERITDPDELAGIWLDLNKRFRPAPLDISYCEQLTARQWQRILHFFKVPLYYIEYGIAQLGALGIWQNSLSNNEKTLSDYWKALSLGGSRPLPELFETAGVSFDMSRQHIAPLVETVRKELWKS
ncbi:Oligoendopeptidase F, plasmid [Sedimentisphaera cyanobacteriorum]|uniref:Oligoendopeptidase F, plasmid n=2 Tax=Sedimentisphaera cyanobacteriorum TaxID=1940790 RepID=A0A1Q2HNV1_9BACT|nr:Oligoendopeptidase F, plasmid [Sedimentisphaera cyanobacteriorum]